MFPKAYECTVSMRGMWIHALNDSENVLLLCGYVVIVINCFAVAVLLF